MLRIGAFGEVGSPSTSSMLRTGTMRGEPVPFVEPLDVRLGGASPSISSMLRTGDRVLVKGDEARPAVAEPLTCPAAGRSNRAKTSLRSSSNTASIDICLAMFATAGGTMRRGAVDWRWCFAFVRGSGYNGAKTRHWRDFNKARAPETLSAID